VSSRARWLIVWSLALLPLLGWWLYGLFDVDEGFYGAVVAEMNRRGEWITPLYNGKPWFEKPILLYWLAKPCLMLFGDLVGPRLPSVLTALGTYGVVAWFANRRYGEKTAQLAVLILASSLLMVAVGRMMLTDMPLILCLTAAMATFWESLVGKPSWRVGTAGLLGFGVLAKGPVALILFVLIAGWTYWREPDLRPAFKGYWPAGTLLMVVIIATWYAPAYAADGQIFVQKFLIEQNVGRFTGGDAAHTLPGIKGFFQGNGMYVGVFLLGMMPWSFFVWHAWPRRAKSGSTPTPSESGGIDGAIPDPALARYLATWAGVVLVFFMVSSAKLMHYILPAFPPLAILLSSYAIQRSRQPMRWFYAAASCCVVMSVLANVGFSIWYRQAGQAEVHGIARYVRKMGGPVAVYQMGRREKELGTGKLKLLETSLPSLLLYLNEDALDTDDLQAILKAPTPLWIITRENRIQPADFIAAQKAGKQLVEIKPPVRQEAFKLYQVR
jgi:4-amino-4-deoxy-L-arabinose transferase-like glycosyltransferase